MSFDDAVRRKTSTDDHCRVWVEVKGGGEVMISDHTWGEVDVQITIAVYDDTKGRWGERIFSKEFDDLPAVWDWLQA